MPYGFLDIASTPGVRAAQGANGSGDYWANFDGDRAFDRFTPAEAAELTADRRLVSIAGGGDTMAALNLAGVTERFTYVSTAGGAS